MPEVSKLFTHDGERSKNTDGLAEALAFHALHDAWPDVQDITYTWTKHYQPDVWLLFATGTIPEEKGTT